MSEFVHLHVHTEYSLLDGACRLPELVAGAKALGQKAIAITDHGVMYGVIDFYKECKKQGIKPIIGCEVYVAPRTRHDKVHRLDTSPYHLTLLCKNEIGYKNLIKMVSAGYIEGFYSRPRIDRELLEAHNEGLICLSGCLAGEIPRALSMGDFNSAKTVALYYKKLFGKDNYYLELMNHGMDEQIRILPLMERLSEETEIPMVATNDSHYINKKDSKLQNVLISIATNQTVSTNNMEFQTDEFYIKSETEMTEIFSSFSGAIENSGKIADACNLEFVFGETKLPYFETSTGEDNESYFREMCYKGLYKFYGKEPEELVVQRLEYELDVIITMGYVDYYLIVHDFIAYARSVDIPVGPGRGSGAGSLAAYCVGITGIDPMKYNLLFERFLNPERISMPDFDIDFCYERRQEVIDYVVDKYGSDHVAQIITFGTMAARGSLRDVGRALGIGYGTVDVIAKAVPFELGITLDLALESSDEFRRLYSETPQNKELIDTARQVEGMVRHASTHAAGVVITRDPADTYVPLQKNEESIVTQFTMNTLEELGLLKMDFLGLRNLTVIQEVENAAKKINPDFSIETIPLDDIEVYELFTQGKTNGIFQFESGGMKSVLMQLRPDHFEDLIAVISLYRPGPMESIPRYVKSRHNAKLVTYAHPLLKSILDVTYGVIVYQEQVMEICRKLAGYSYGRADLVRRAMSKKDHDIMKKERHHFIFGMTNPDGTTECVGAVANGVEEYTANAIFNDMSTFASYAFNKSHAAAYALIAYQTAYLKCHYPKEYMAALMTSVLENTGKVTEYIGEAKKMGIDVLPPTINTSTAGFTVVGEDIRFGLLAVKGIGKGFIEKMVEEREQKGLYIDLLDLFERLHGRDLNKRVVEGLIKCGALDEFGHTRRSLVSVYESVLSNVETEHKNNVSGQLDLFGMGDSKIEKSYSLPQLAEYTLIQKLSMEKECCGLYLSGHPLAEYEEEISKLGVIPIERFHRKSAQDGDLIRTVGIVSSKESKITRNNETMAFVNLEDKSGTIDTIVFPKVYQQTANLIVNGTIVFVRGWLKISPEEEPQLLCETVLSLEEALEKEQINPKSGTSISSKLGIYLKLPSENSDQTRKTYEILVNNGGTMPVFYYFQDTKKYIRTPKKMWVHPSQSLSQELRTLLGEENVVLME